MPKAAMAEVKWGVNMTSMPRKGCCRCSSRGIIATGSRAEGKDQGEPGHVLQVLLAEDMVEGGKDEGAGHQTGHVGIHDDLDAPVDKLVGVDETLFDGPFHAMDNQFMSSISSPHCLVQADIEDLRLGAVFVFKNRHPLVHDHLGDRIVGILQIADLPGSEGAGLDAGGLHRPW